MTAGGGLNILHVFRAPVGGLFRHVCDLARGQTARGHRVGLIVDSSGGAQAAAVLDDLSGRLALGVTRTPMPRQLGLNDIAATRLVARRAGEVEADVLHGHGAKGGAYARLATGSQAIRVYTPHGGSLHYSWTSPAGLIYLTAEAALKLRTDLFLFESRYALDTFTAKVGAPAALTRLVYNGVDEAEFLPVKPDAQPTDLLFIGELRMLKGVDVLIEALGLLKAGGRDITATIVGDGPDRQVFEASVAKRGLGSSVRFVGAKPARTAFAMGRILVVPSRSESLPYVVLEAAAAGIPVIATAVGGIPEIFGPDARDLVPPGDAVALSQAIASALHDRGTRHSASLRLKARVRASFSVGAMTEAVLAAYRDAIPAGNRQPAAHPPVIAP